MKVFRLHGVTAKVFENSTEKGKPYHKVLVERTYRDGKGNWQTTSSFNVDDLPLVSFVACRASRYVEKINEHYFRVDLDELIKEELNAADNAEMQKIIDRAMRDAE